nr:serine/threonine-protein kinase [Kofleriaceae bacterium]
MTARGSGDDASAETLRDGSQGGGAARTDSLPTVDRRHYTIDRELARGGMGRIFTARDRRLDRTVAVKEVLSNDGDLTARFAREVRLTARLQHPGIVSIYEAGRWDTGEPFYAMRLVAGRPLHEVMVAAKTLAARLALLPRLAAVAEAVAYAHDQRIIHRDLKPHNVLVGTYGETVVIDWGLAKDLDSADDSLPAAAPDRDKRVAAGSDSITVFGSVMGTPAYMPVEQATGQPLDARADVYAIGAMMYQALAGRAPYLGKSADHVLDQLVAGAPPPLARVAPDVPADVVAIVERAMARELGRRYETAKALAEDLRLYLDGKLVAAHAYSPGELLRRWVTRHRGAVAVGAVAAVALAGVGVASYARVVAEKARADVERDAAQVAQADAERAQAAMLVDRARATIVAGQPARAAPLLAAALDLGAKDAEVIEALAGQVAAALPAPAWTKRIARPEALAVTDAGELVVPPPVAPLAARAGAAGDASVAVDVAGAWLAMATPVKLALWDVAAGRERASVVGCGADDDALLEVDAVTASGTVAGVCRGIDNGPSRLAVWVPASAGAGSGSGSGSAGGLVLGDAVIGRLHGAVASDDGRVAAAIEDGVDAPRVVRDGAQVTLAALPGATSVAVDASGTLVAAGTSGGLVQVWDVATAREIAVLVAGEPVVAVALAPGGGLVVAAGKRGDAVAWRTDGMLRPQLIAAVAGAETGTGSASNARRVPATGAGPDPATIVALRGTDRGARWATATRTAVVAYDDRGARVGALAAPAGAVFDAGVALGAAPSAIAAIAHRGATASVVVGVGSGAIELPLRDPLPIGASFSDDDRYVFAGGQIFDVAAARATGDQGSGAVWGCGTPRAERAACFVDRDPGGNGERATVAAFRMPDGGAVELRARLPVPSTAFAFTRDAIVVGGCAGELAVADTMTGDPRPSVRLDQAACVTDLEASDASGLGVVALASKRVALWELATGKLTGAIALDRPAEAFAMSATGELLAIATGDGRVGVWDTRTRAQLASAKLDDAPRGLRVWFLDEGALIVTTESRAWRIPWTQWADGAPDRSWRGRSPFVRAGLEVEVGGAGGAGGAGSASSDRH